MYKNTEYLAPNRWGTCGGTLRERKGNTRSQVPVGKPAGGAKGEGGSAGAWLPGRESNGGQRDKVPVNPGSPGCVGQPRDGQGGRKKGCPEVSRPGGVPNWPAPKCKGTDRHAGAARRFPAHGGHAIIPSSTP